MFWFSSSGLSGILYWNARDSREQIRVVNEPGTECVSEFIYTQRRNIFYVEREKVEYIRRVERVSKGIPRLSLSLSLGEHVH